MKYYDKETTLNFYNETVLPEFSSITTSPQYFGETEKTKIFNETYYLNFFIEKYLEYIEFIDGSGEVLNFGEKSKSLEFFNISSAPQYLDDAPFILLFDKTTTLGFSITERGVLIRKMLLDFLDVITWGDIF